MNYFTTLWDQEEARRLETDDCRSARDDRSLVLLHMSFAEAVVEKRVDLRGDLLSMGLEGEVSGVVKMDLGVGNVTLERLCAYSGPW